MTTRLDLRTEVGFRLGDTGNTVFTVPELNGYIDKAIKGLYPTYFKLQVASTTATDGPLQTNPSGARGFHYIGLQKVGSTRVRLLRQWKEGVTSTFIPKTGIAGQTLTWAWTSGFEVPGDDSSTLDVYQECEEVVVLRTCITALERVLSSRVETQKYFALTVREGVTEADLSATLDALHASLQQRLDQAVKRPDRVG